MFWCREIECAKLHTHGYCKESTSARCEVSRSRRCLADQTLGATQLYVCCSSNELPQESDLAYPAASFILA